VEFLPDNGHAEPRESGETIAKFRLRHYPIFSILDSPPQISLFRKLKLTNCAPIPGLPATGFFMRQSDKPPGGKPRRGFFMSAIRRPERLWMHNEERAR
jgi:hypothetical protein